MIRLRLPPRDALRLILIGLVVREAFSFWTGHPFDTEIWLRNAYFVSAGMNPYAPMAPVPGISFAYASQTLPSVAYLPLWSLILAGLYRAYAVLPFANRFVLYFLVKQPPILGDVILGLVLYRAVAQWGGTLASARSVLRFWMFFPYTIVISSIWGMFDAIAAVVLISSLLPIASWKKSSLLGLAILLKSIPVVFFPYEFFRTRGRDRWTILMAGAIPLFFTLGVFALTGWGFQDIARTLSWESHGAPQGMTFQRLLGSPYVIPFLPSFPLLILLFGYVWIPAIMIGTIWIRRRIPGNEARAAVQCWAFVAVVFFLTRWVVNEQYLIYLLPLLLLDVRLWHPERRDLFTITWILGFVFLVFNNPLLVRFTAPTYLGALDIEYYFENLSPFALPWRVSLDVLGIAFSIHLIQLGLVIANPRRSAVPWLTYPFRLRWLSPVRTTLEAEGNR